MTRRRSQARQGVGGAWIVAVLGVLALGSVPLARAERGETAHYGLGIVVKDARDGYRRGARVIELLGPSTGRELRRGDLVIRVGDVRVHDGAEIREALRELNDDPISVEVVRHGRRQRIEALRMGSRLDGLGDRIEARVMAREIRRNVMRDVRRNVMRDVRRDLGGSGAWLGADRARLRDQIRRLEDQLNDLELRLEAEGWR